MLVTTSTGEDPAIERVALENFSARGVDGVILTPCEPRRHGGGISRKSETPAVQIDRHFEGDEGFVVSSHHFASAQTLTQQILVAGAEEITFLTGSPANPTTQQRIEGFQSTTAALQSGDKRFVIRSSDRDTEDGGYDLMSAAAFQPV